MTRKLLLGGLIVVVLGFAILHLHYPLDFVVRVLLKQDSDFDDFRWKPSLPVSASPSPRPIRRAVDSRPAQTAFQAHPRVHDLNRFMTSIGSTALLVLKDGELLLEEYYNGSSEQAMQAVFSVSKSVFSVLLGGSVARSRLGHLETPITDYLPELAARDPGFARITLGNLLDMKSGLAFDPSVDFPFINQDPPLIYYTNDMRTTVLEHTRVESEPGHFRYNDYNPNLLGLALERRSDRGLVELFEREVWQPLGTENDALWSTDYEGFPMLESGFVASGRDLVRFGGMMLDGGFVGDLRLIAQDWHHRSTHWPDPPQLDEYNGRQWGYRTGWWLIARPSGPPDYSAIGRFGQFIYVSPKNGVVIVRTGRERSGVGDRDLTEIFYAASDRLGGGL